MIRHLAVWALPCVFLLSAQTKAEPASSRPEDWSIHFQATTIPQYHPGFPAGYSGANSLPSSAELAASLTATLFLGKRLWSGGEIYLNPELAGGSGIGQTHGIAGFPNGEIYRVDDAAPKANLSRLYLKQVFGMGGASERIEPDKNQLSAQVDSRRLTLIAGKFSLNDFFDNNAYAHDPRTQFMNWALMDNGAWDYAADTRGYTWGILAEYHEARWAIRLATALEPKIANQLEFDTDLAHAHGDQIEAEYHYSFGEHPGTVRWLAYLNHAHMGNYAIATASASPGSSPDVTLTRDYRTKGGMGLNLEQEVTSDLGLFSRLGWSDGVNETWAFTEIDQTISLGASLKGTAWSRAQDVAGLALILNGLSSDHANYLAAGGYGFLIGDGALSYAPEQIVETYYSFQAIQQLSVSADFQLVNHPGYNQDRGPVATLSGRLHYEF